MPSSFPSEPGPVAGALMGRLGRAPFEAPVTFILCVSGGRDSMLLLRLFEELAACGRLAREPIVFHYNHRLRAAAEEDCEFVRKTVRRIGWAFYIKEGDVRRAARRLNMSLEAAGRHMRYRALRRLRDNLGSAATVVTGHHADDYVESLLLHLIRGGGPAALETMPLFARLDGLSIFRPLLVLDRARVDGLVQEAGLDFREDESNTDEAFRRNRLRNRVMGELRELGLDSVKLRENFHDDAHEDPDAAGGDSNGTVGRAISAPTHLLIDRELLRGSRRGERKQLLDLYARRLGLPPIDRALLEQLDRQLAIGPRFRLLLPSGDLLFWSDRRGPVHLFRASRSPALRPFRVRDLPGPSDSGQAREVCVVFNGQERTIALEPGQRVDAWHAGDRVALKGGGRQKVKKIYQQLGLPAPVREHLPLVRAADGPLVERLLLGFWEGPDRAYPSGGRD